MVHLLSAALLGLVALLPAAAHAQNSAFSIAPLGSTLVVKPEGKQPQEIFSVTNSGTGDVSLDIDVYRWTQDAQGKSDLSATRDFLIYPKTLVIKKGQTRAVRLIRRSDQGALDAQAYYRVQFRELAPSFTPSQSSDAAQVAIVTRVLVSLVLQPDGFKEVASFELRQSESGLQVHNPSKALLKLSSLYCGQDKLSGLLYVHPGVTAQLPGTRCDTVVRALREGIGETTHEVLSAP
jgi:P pilus assembly chaperone PapD